MEKEYVDNLEDNIKFIQGVIDLLDLLTTEKHIKTSLTVEYFYNLSTLADFNKLQPIKTDSMLVRGYYNADKTEFFGCLNNQKLIFVKLI